MADKITENRIKLLHPELRAEVSEIYAKINQALKGKAICRFSHTLRTFDEQDELYRQGRSKPGGIVTNAKGGQSNHNYGLAIDIVLLKDMNGDGTFETASWETTKDFDCDGIADWMEVVKIFKSYGWEWGGDWRFKDLPHFQKTFGLSIDALLGRHRAKRYTNGYIDLH